MRPFSSQAFSFSGGLFTAVKTEAGTGRKLGAAFFAYELGREIKSAGGAEIVPSREIFGAAGAFPDYHHLMSAVRTKAAVKAYLSMTFGAVHSALCNYLFS